MRRTSTPLELRHSGRLDFRVVEGRQNLFRSAMTHAEEDDKVAACSGLETQVWSSCLEASASSRRSKRVISVQMVKRNGAMKVVITVVRNLVVSQDKRSMKL